ncbi:unnamed protein product [Toxocara canis]|uniref:Uncharacterized protein n=1 Tax=Toxocara canis TaxID=6265 RepID=A0A183U589_TOXCA|nr:unnamed protein product [Toxocara canis]
MAFGFGIGVNANQLLYQVDEERTMKEQKIKESISWPVIIEQMRNAGQQEAETSGGTSLLKSVASNKGKPIKSEKETTESDNDEDEALQERDTWSESEHSSSSSDEFIDVHEPCTSFPKANPLSTSISAAIDLSEPIREDEEVNATI